MRKREIPIWLRFAKSEIPGVPRKNGFVFASRPSPFLCGPNGFVLHFAHFPLIRFAARQLALFRIPITCRLSALRPPGPNGFVSHFLSTRLPPPSPTSRRLKMASFFHPRLSQPPSRRPPPLSIQGFGTLNTPPDNIVIEVKQCN